MTPQEDCIQHFVTEHPIQAASLIAGGITVTAASAAVAAPILGALGFGAGGVVHGSLAAIIQASAGPIAGNSLFTILQSAGVAGGMGMSAVKTAILGAAGGAMTAGPVRTLLQCLSNATAT